MKALKYLLFLLLIAVIGFSVYVALQPSEYKITVTKNMDVPIPVAYNIVNDFNNWDPWLSLTEKQPDLVVTISGSGVGPESSLSWELDKHSGMVETESVNPEKLIQQKIQYENFPPMNGLWSFSTSENTTNIAFTLVLEDLSFRFKAKSIISGGIENRIKSQLEDGLKKLDSFITAQMSMYTITVDGITNHSGGFYLYTSTSCKMDVFPKKMEESLSYLKQFVRSNQITTAGSPFVLFHKWDRDNNAVLFSSCIPTTEKVITTSPDILTGQLESFKALKTTLKGDYSNLNEAWEKANNYISQYNLKASDDGPMIELYVTDPKTTPNPADWITEIFIALE
ncbi:GyrI-like domain-containing protein [Gaetbulibacter sp. M240]|uniref:GyrI-like domain-containing protein n=1 Tax=Gaetbulibacter sp. M240 TaxID=3126511 RepID=UPI00374EECF0